MCCTYLYLYFLNDFDCFLTAPTPLPLVVVMAPPQDFQKVVFRLMPDNLENYRARIGTFCPDRNTKCKNTSLFSAAELSLGFHFVIIPLLLLTASITVVAINRQKKTLCRSYKVNFAFVSIFCLPENQNSTEHGRPQKPWTLPQPKRKALFCYMECKLYSCQTKKQNATNRSPPVRRKL